MSTFIPTGHATPVADTKMIQVEVIGQLIFTLSADTSWRGKPTFEIAVTHVGTGTMRATTCGRYGLAKRTYKRYIRQYT